MVMCSALLKIEQKYQKHSPVDRDSREIGTISHSVFYNKFLIAVALKLLKKY